MLRAGPVFTNTISIRCATTRLSRKSPSRLPVNRLSGRGVPGQAVNAIHCIGVATLKIQTQPWPQNCAADFLLAFRASLTGVTMRVDLSKKLPGNFIVVG